MPSALSIIGAATLALVGVAGMYEWDRHPPLGWHAHVLFWNPGFNLPDSLATQRDKALQGAEKAESAKKQCLGELGSQNASLSRQASLDAFSLRQAQVRLDAGAAEVARLRQSAAALRVYVPVGADACARWQDADGHVLAALMTGATR
jgi:hypothetical protein